MDGENYWNVFYQRVGGVQRAQKDGNECRLPVVAVEHVGGPNVFGDFDRSAAKFAVTLGVVGKISRAGAVHSFAVEVAGVVDEKIAYSVEHGAVGDGGEAQARAQGDGHAGHNHHARFDSPITGQHDGEFMALGDKGFG